MELVRSAKKKLGGALRRLGERLAADGNDSPPPAIAAPPAPVAADPILETERRCQEVAHEIAELCVDLKRSPDRVVDDLVVPNPRLVWENVDSSKDLAWLDEARLERLAAAFHGSIEVRFEESGADSEIFWSSLQFDSRAEAETALRKLRQTLRLVLEITDRPALGGWLLGGGSGLILIVPIFAPDILTANLGSLSLLEEDGWNQIGVDFGRFSVLVGVHGTAPRVDAGLIQVCSCSQVQAAMKSAASAAGDLETACRVERWRLDFGDLQLKAGVTPLHFRLRRSPAQGGEEQQCARLAAELALAYLADRVVLGPPTRLTFRGFRPMEVELPGNGLPSAEGGAALCDLVKWSCDDRIADRLEVVQRLISLRLTDDAKANYSEVLAAAPRLLVAADENWQVYLGQATQVYFERQKELGDYLAAKVAQYSERLEALVKGLSGYGITLLGFFFTDYLVKQQDPTMAPASRHSIASAFFYYSLAILTVIFGHAAAEEVLLGKELAGERSRLMKFFGDEELRESVDRTILRRKAQFRVLLSLFVVVAVAALLAFYDHIVKTYGGLKW